MPGQLSSDSPTGRTESQPPIKSLPESPGSRFFLGGRIRSIRPGRHERAGTATVAGRRTPLRICFCDQRDAPRTADRFPKMPLQYRAAIFTCVLGMAAIIAVCEGLVTLWASQHGYLTYM